MNKQKVTVKDTDVYIQNRELTAEEQQSTDVRYHKGPPPGPDMPDHDLESHEHRRHFMKDEAEICIGLQPGDELGEIFVNVQLEGAIGEYNSCIEKQNEILQVAADGLADILGDFAAEWEVKIAATPCPQATDQIKLKEVANKLEGKVEQIRSVDRGVPVRTTVTNEVKP